MNNTENPTKQVADQNVQAAAALGNDVVAAAGASPSTDQPAVSVAGTAASQSSQNIQTAKDFLVSIPASDTAPEHELLDALKAYRLAAEERFKHLLTGMANSTAEALRFLAEAEIHLADHIAQQENPKS